MYLLKTSLLGVALVTSTLIANADTIIWQGQGTDALWQTIGNWESVAAPSEFDVLSFGPNGAGLHGTTLDNDFAGGFQFNGLTFSDDTSFTLIGNGIALGGDINVNSSVDQTIDFDLDLATASTFSVDNGVTLNANGAITGNFGVTKAGFGTLIMRGANTNTGDTLLQQGTIIIGQTGNLNPATNLIIGGHSTNSSGLATYDVRGDGGATKSITSLQVVPGLSQVVSSRSSGSGDFIGDLGSITQSDGGLINFSSGSNTQITTSSTNTNGILGAWATVGGNYATVNAGQIEAFSAYNDLVGTSPSIANDGTSNVQITSANQIDLSSGATTDGSAVVTVADTTGLIAGATIRGSGIPNGSTIVSVDDATTITISNNASADNTGQSFTAANTIGTSGGTTDINTLRLTTDNVQNVDLGGGTLRLGQDGGVWRTSDSDFGRTDVSRGLVINNGTLTAGGADNTAGEIVFDTGGDNSRESRGNRAIRVNANVSDNGTGSVAVTKTGQATLELAGTNTYTGGTFLNQGRLYIPNGSTMGTGDVFVNGNASELNVSGGVHNNDITVSGIGHNTHHPRTSSVNGSGGAIILNDGAELTGTITLADDTRISATPTYNTVDNGTISGRITGDATLQMAGTNNIDFGTITLSNTGNDWTGGLTISGNFSSGSRQAIIELGNSEVIPHGANAGDLTFQSNRDSGSQRFRLNGFDETINGIQSVNGGTGTGSTTYLENNGATDATLTFGANDANGVFNGRTNNGSSGSLSLTKIGAGTQEFTGNNVQHTGTTTVNNGVLLVSGELSNTSGVVVNGGEFAYTNNGVALDRDVTVNAGGKFRYDSATDYAGALTLNGAIAGTNWNGMGDLLIAGGASVAPGNSPGQATGTDQTWGDGGSYEFEINDAMGTSGINWDDIDLSGDLDLSGLNTGGFTIALTSLNISGEPGEAANFDELSNYSWEIISYNTITGSFSEDLFDIDTSGFQNAINGSFSVSQVGSSLALNYTAVPEPTTYALLCGVAVIAFALRRRR